MEVPVIRTLSWSSGADPETLLAHEWLVTNGLGGYASGTVAGVITRRYHGLLIASLPAPLGRMMMLNHLAERLHLSDNTTAIFGAEESAERELDIRGAAHLRAFFLEDGLPVWRYEFGQIVLEKRVLMPHMQNSVHVTYRMIEGEGNVRLELRPSMHFRPHGDPVSGILAEPYHLAASGARYEVSKSADMPVLRLQMVGSETALTLDGGTTREIFYRMEADRGYEARGMLWSPGVFTVPLSKGREATLVASTEEWTTIEALKPHDAPLAEVERCRRLLLAAQLAAREGLGAELTLAADQFIIVPAGRVEHEARARAAGEQVYTIVAGYYWFTDWGRDTMISLEGLTLVTGRHAEAAWILGLFADYIKDGLIPNLFPEGENEGLYHTADATLWFFHSLDRYLRATGDRALLRLLLPKLHDIVEHHLRGTHFGICVDPEDGLLRQGAEGYQLTWMDAKVDGWVVTPRRGKAVEINALWYNALRLLEQWTMEEKGADAARPIGEHAERARRSFNAKFWFDQGGYLYDVVDGEKGNDSACRPNQLFAFSLCHPILDQDRWGTVLQVVQEQLLTPVGLRSLAPGHPDYKPKYFGDLRARDAAYHQGTVWAWLIGPFIDAWLAVHPGDLAGARKFLEGFGPAMESACVGTISEVFDAEAPFTPRGCIAQAWSVAEVLRCWVKTAAHDTLENRTPS